MGSRAEAYGAEGSEKSEREGERREEGRDEVRANG